MGEREQGHPQLDGKFKASLGYRRTAPKPNQTNQKNKLGGQNSWDLLNSRALVVHYVELLVRSGCFNICCPDAAIGPVQAP